MATQKLLTVGGKVLTATVDGATKALTAITIPSDIPDPDAWLEGLYAIFPMFTKVGDGVSEFVLPNDTTQLFLAVSKSQVASIRIVWNLVGLVPDSVLPTGFFGPLAFCSGVESLSKSVSDYLVIGSFAGSNFSTAVNYSGGDHCLQGSAKLIVAYDGTIPISYARTMDVYRLR